MYILDSKCVSVVKDNYELEAFLKKGFAFCTLLLFAVEQLYCRKIEIEMVS